jgi:hypothetical protein
MAQLAALVALAVGVEGQAESRMILLQEAQTQVAAVVQVRFHQQDLHLERLAVLEW